MYVTSPGGYKYPRALGWDLSAEDLELALEWTFDIGEVTVSYSEDSNSTRSYRVTFEVSEISTAVLPSCRGIYSILVDVDNLCFSMFIQQYMLLLLTVAETWWSW